MPNKIRTVATSIVTWATLVSGLLTGLVAELRASDQLPDNWTGPAIAIVAPLAAIFAISASVVRRVMPVPEELRGLD
jgi:hypothetical protein